MSLSSFNPSISLSSLLSSSSSQVLIIFAVAGDQVDILDHDHCRLQQPREVHVSAQQSRLALP